MRVTDSAILMTSRHTADQAYSRQESLRAWVGDRPPDRAIPNRPLDLGLTAGADRLEISAEAKQALTAAPAAPAPAPEESPLPGVSKEDWLRILILRHLLGIDVKAPEDLVRAIQDAKTREDAAAAAPPPPPASASGSRAQGGNGPQREGWGVDYRSHETYEETEQLSVSMAGTIKTADGMEVAFSVELTMSRRYYEETNVHIRAGDALKPVDPLVINFGGTAAEITSTRFAFDIDGNGTKDLIPTLGAGSGYLALDKIGDGVINDGKELFGPSSGDAFAELAAADADGSGWIDEHDPIFDKLRIWTRDAGGEPRLLALGEVGIGAIYVGSVEAPFTVKDMQNQSLAVNQKAGLFVRENGTVGTVQQLDLMV
jgi:hypothetical protein